MKGATRYIFSMGELHRKDNSLTFRSEKGLVHMPIEGIKELYMMNEVTINTKLLDFLSHQGICVHFFNYYGYYSGSYYPKDKYLSGKVTVKQALAYSQERMSLAVPFVSAIQENMIYYLKSKKYKDSDIINEACHLIRSVDVEQEDIKRLLAAEGELWQYFYKTLNQIIDESFISNKRVKRPPDNPLNAMISFGNSWLYSKVISQLYHTHVDQGISFLHEPSEGRFSLSLDVAEVFKLIIVFPVIVTMINKRMITVIEHFDKNLNYCYLNEEGRKKFIVELEKKLSSTFKHQSLNRPVSYETAIKFEGYKLIKHFIEDKPFMPFSEKEKM